MWSDPDPQLGRDFQQQGLRITRLNIKATTMPIKGPVPAKKKKKKVNSICLITQPVAHMDGPGRGTDGQNAATRS